MALFKLTKQDRDYYALQDLLKPKEDQQEETAGIGTKPGKQEQDEEGRFLSFFGGLFDRSQQQAEELAKLAQEEAERSALEARLMREASGITKSLTEEDVAIRSAARDPSYGSQMPEDATLVDVTDTDMGKLTNEEPLYELAEAIDPGTIDTSELPSGKGLMSPVTPSVYKLEGPEAGTSASSLALAKVKEPVSKGAKGNIVEQLKNKLLDLGYDVGRGGTSGLTKNKAGQWTSLDNSQRRGVDGVFGKGVESAIKAFQEDAGLPVTGVLDEDTAANIATARALQFKGLDTEELTEDQTTYYNAALKEAKEQGLEGVELASFMAQAGHESDSFRTLTERASGAAYEGRKDLGNTQKGDGKRYKGRGHIQLTGRANYKKAGDDLGIDLVNNPDLISTDPSVAAKVSLWFWKNKVRKQSPDFADVERVTKVVNGGFNGLAHRKKLFDQMTQSWNETSQVSTSTAPRPMLRPDEEDS